MKMLRPFFAPGLALLLLQGCQSTGGVAGYVGEPASSSGDGSTAPEVEQGSVPAVEGLPPDPGPRATYRVGPYDQLQVHVFQAEELSSKYRVDEQGRITMPLIGTVQVGGLTPQEAQSRIADALGRDYLQNPQVSIFVDEFATLNVTVAGAVRGPGVYPFSANTTLMQAIALARGVNEVAKKDGVLLFRRRDDGGVRAYVLDLAEIQKGELRDPPLAPDDRIVVPESGAKLVFRTVTGPLRAFYSPTSF